MSKSLFRLAAEADAAGLRKWYYSLPEEERLRFDYSWSIHGRPEQQIPPGAWHAWLCLAGRGWGKTRTGGQYANDEAKRLPGSRGALVGATAADVRDVMINGESGILAKSPPWFRPTYEPSKRLLTWPNGTIATTYSAEEPDRLRGPQHHWYWADELAAWQYPEAWDMLMFGMRLGLHPRGIVTTTPRPTPEIRALVKDSSTHLYEHALSTYDNEDNLPESFLHTIVAKYEGTRLGRQELYAEILDDTPGALWKRATIEAGRVKSHPELKRVIVAIDPAVSTKDNSAETGIVVVGIGDCACKKGKPEVHGFVIQDDSGNYTPLEWAKKAIGAYRELGAHRIIAEVNNGGDLVISNIESVDPTVHPFPVHATDGKRTRAEPVAGLYEQGRIHHVGVLSKLEDQMCTWAALTTGERSPDRVDALVWGVSYLMLDVEDLSLPARPVVPWFGGRRSAR